MTYVNAVDTSFHRLTPDQAQALRHAGFDIYLQCLWTGVERPTDSQGDIAVNNLQVAKDAGFTICGYISLAGARGGEYHVGYGRRKIPNDLWDALAMVFIDIELAGIPNADIREAVDILAAMGKRRAIYTSYHAWVDFQGNVKTFTDCLLFNAFWDGVSDVDYPWHRFGGFPDEAVVGEQYTGGEYIEGVFCDRSVFVKELLEGAGEDDDMARADEVRTELLGYIGNCLQTLGKQAEVINALGNGLASVAKTVYALESTSGEFNTTRSVSLDEMQTQVDAVKAQVEEQRQRAVAAAQAILGATDGSNPSA